MLKLVKAIGLTLALLAPAELAAEPPRRAERPAIEVFVAADARQRAELESVIRELLGRLSVEVRVTHVARVEPANVAAPPTLARPAVAFAWIDMRPARAPTLYVVDPAADRVLVRRVQSRPGDEELVREQLAHILEAAIEGLLSGEPIGAPRREVFKAAPPASQRSPRRPKASVLELGAFYEVQHLSSEVPLTQGPLLSALFRSNAAGPRFGVWATAQYRQPLHVHSEPVDARFQAGALRLLGSADVPVWASTRLRGAVGAGLDLVHVQPETRNRDRARAAEAQTLSFAVLRAALGLEFELSDWASLGALLALDFDPSGTSYVFVSERGDQTVMTPLELRPGALLGLSFR